MSIMRKWQRRTIFQLQKHLFAEYRKMSTPGPVPKNDLDLVTYVQKGYELDLNFYETKTNRIPYHSSKNEVKLFRENIVVIEEEWFIDMKLTDGATFPTALIKRAKLIFNQKMKIPRDTEQHTQEISTNNGWNTQVIQILREDRGGKCLFKVNMISRPQKPV